MMPPWKLQPHWRNEQIFRQLSDAKDQELLEHIRQHGVRRPIVVTGQHCECAPYTILSGHRRWRTAWQLELPLVEVLIRDNLTAADELEILVVENLGDQLGRKLTPTQKAELERLLFEQLKIGRGTRTDLKTSVTGNQSSAAMGASPLRTTLARIAGQTGDSQSTIAARHKAVFSLLSTPKLKEALDSGVIKENPAARLLREVERDPAVRTALSAHAIGVATPAQKGTIEAAQRMVDAALEQRLQAQKPSRRRRAKGARSSTEIATAALSSVPVDPKGLIYLGEPAPVIQEFEKVTAAFAKLAAKYPVIASRYMIAHMLIALRAMNAQATTMVEAIKRQQTITEIERLHAAGRRHP